MKLIRLSVAAIMLAHAAQADEPLRLGMTPEPYMPFTAVDSAGQWIGLEGDLTRAICDLIAEGCEFKSMAWEGLIPSLEKGKVDFVVGTFSVTEDRKKIVDFSTPYYTEGTAFVGSADDEREIRLIDAEGGSGQVISSEGLEGVIIGVQSSSVQANYVAAYLPDVEVKSYDTADNSVADLVAGRVDYLLVPDMFIDGFLKSSDGEGFEVKLEVPDNPVLGQGVAYAVAKGDAATLEKVNAALAELKSDGKLETMIQRWIFGHE